MITPEDEKRFNLKPLPDVPFIGTPECERLRAEYEAQRVAYRQQHPVIPQSEC